MSTGIGLRSAYPPPYNGVLRSQLGSPTQSSAPLYGNTRDTTHPDFDFAQLSRGIAPASRPGSVLRTKLVVGIDYGPT